MKITLIDNSNEFKLGAVMVLERLGYDYDVETDEDDNEVLDVDVYENNASEPTPSATNMWDSINNLVNGVYGLLVWIIIGVVIIAAISHNQILGWATKWLG